MSPRPPPLLSSWFFPSGEATTQTRHANCWPHAVLKVHSWFRIYCKGFFRPRNRGARGRRNAQFLPVAKSLSTYARAGFLPLVRKKAAFLPSFLPSFFLLAPLSIPQGARNTNIRYFYFVAFFLRGTRYGPFSTRQQLPRTTPAVSRPAQPLFHARIHVFPPRKREKGFEKKERNQATRKRKNRNH